MLQRVLADAREAATVERRQAAVLRQLSTFLGDASIAADGSDSFDEMLQLVAEHARELIGARRCVARLTLDGSRPLRAVAAADEGADGRVTIATSTCSSARSRHPAARSG